MSSSEIYNHILIPLIFIGIGFFFQLLLLLPVRLRTAAGTWSTLQQFRSAILLPLSSMLWLFLATVWLYNFSSLDFGSRPWATNVQRLLFLALGIWLCLRLLHHVEKLLMIRYGAQQNLATVLHLGVRIVQITILSVAVLAILPILGYSLSGILLLGSVGGLVAGIAFRDILANLFAGFVMYVDQPFNIGDYISLRNGSYLGKIIRTGWRSTEVLTRERRRLHIPNHLLLTEMVENISNIDRRRIREVFGIRYSDLPVLPAIVGDVQKMLSEHPKIDPLQDPLSVMDTFGESSLHILIDALAHTGEWVEYKKIRHELFLNIAQIVHRHGADFAFPTRTVHMVAATEQTLPQKN